MAAKKDAVLGYIQSWYKTASGYDQELYNQYNANGLAEDILEDIESSGNIFTQSNVLESMYNLMFA